ncbi:MAG TPA: hypothetical protein VGH62_13815 [Bradyrhizobium sp.]|jgi:hypothetical protein
MLPADRLITIVRQSFPDFGAPNRNVCFPRWADTFNLTAYDRLSTKDGRDTESTRAINNRPMSSRSQALFRSITEVKHVLRQHDLQINQQSRSSSSLVSGPEMVLENLACVVGRNSIEVGTTVSTQATPPS